MLSDEDLENLRKMSPDKFYEITLELINRLITDYYGDDSYFIIIIGDPIRKITKTGSNIDREVMYNVLKSLVEESEAARKSNLVGWKLKQELDIKKDDKKSNLN